MPTLRSPTRRSDRNGSSPGPVTRVGQRESERVEDPSKVEGNNKTDSNQKVSKKVRDDVSTISATGKDPHGASDLGEPIERPAGLKPKQKGKDIGKLDDEVFKPLVLLLALPV